VKLKFYQLQSANRLVKFIRFSYIISVLVKYPYNMAVWLYAYSVTSLHPVCRLCTRQIFGCWMYVGILDFLIVIVETCSG